MTDQTPPPTKTEMLLDFVATLVIIVGGLAAYAWLM